VRYAVSTPQEEIHLAGVEACPQQMVLELRVTYRPQSLTRLFLFAYDCR
jgi:hypothetical protein